MSQFNGVSPLITAGSGVVNDGSWHHVAWTRSGSGHTLWLDGVSVGTGTWAGTMPDIAANIFVGNHLPTAGTNFNGHIDDLRISIGSPVYTSAFTPPASAHPDS